MGMGMLLTKQSGIFFGILSESTEASNISLPNWVAHQARHEDNEQIV